MRGNQLEPGDRENAATNIITLDMTELDKRERKKERGKVTITPITEPVQQEPAPEVKAEEPEKDISELQKLSEKLKESENQ